MSAGYRFVSFPDGAREVVYEEGKGVRGSSQAAEAAADRCFRCHRQIGTHAKFHEVSGRRVHADCCRTF